MVDQNEHRAELERHVRASERGFGIIELLVVMAVMVIIISYSVMNFRSAQVGLRQQGAAQEFAAYLEKARADAMRRHGSASVQVTAANAYTVILDFNYDGAPDTRTIKLPQSVTFSNAASSPAAMIFDWRGQVADFSGAPSVCAAGQANIPIIVNRAGDVAVNGAAVVAATPTATTASDDIDTRATLIAPSSTP